MFMLLLPSRALTLLMNAKYIHTQRLIASITENHWICLYVCVCAHAYIYIYIIAYAFIHTYYDTAYDARAAWGFVSWMLLGTVVQASIQLNIFWATGFRLWGVGLFSIRVTVTVTDDLWKHYHGHGHGHGWCMNLRAPICRGYSCVRRRAGPTDSLDEFALQCGSFFSRMRMQIGAASCCSLCAGQCRQWSHGLSIRVIYGGWNGKSVPACFGAPACLRCIVFSSICFFSYYLCVRVRACACACVCVCLFSP
jgi:hypothetical protein